MNNRAEGMLDSLAAVLILFTALLDPMVSAVLAVIFLLGSGVYHLTQKA
ncbi:hypothetical protein [Chloroflexus sp.]|nr:hypothetical protein [uncultured Chloroflexus sp.]